MPCGKTARFAVRPQPVRVGIGDVQMEGGPYDSHEPMAQLQAPARANSGPVS